MCIEKSTRHGKMDKTQKITLKQKIHGKNDFDKTISKVENGKIMALGYNP